MLYLLFQPLILLVLSWSSGPEIPDRSHVIVWDESRLLAYEDFKSDNGPRGTEAALAVVGIEYSASMTSKKYEVSIVTMFDTRKSWFSRDMFGNNNILKHEQGHFDLAEIHARKLRKSISESNFRNKDVFDRVSVMYKDANRKLHLDQLRYDRETHHSVNSDEQKEWDEKIAYELKSLEKYKDTLIVIRFR